MGAELSNNYCSPEWANAALLTIDVQQVFTLPGSPAEIPGTAETEPAIRRLVEAFRRCSEPIIHVVRLYLPDGSNVDPCRRQDLERGKRIVLPGTGGADLVDELKPSPDVRLDAGKLLDGEL